MRKLLWLLCMLLPFACLSQGVAPAWIQTAVRERNYPADEWYTGFAREKLKPNADAAIALKSLERNAQNALAESIIVTIDGHTEVENTSTQLQAGDKRAEVIATEYKQAVTAATKATTVKSEVKSWHDPQSGMLYAFAAVKRSDLAAFYKKQINLDLNKTEIGIGVSEQMVAAGKKMSARRKIEECQKILAGVSYQSDLLAAVDAEVNDDDLQTQRAKELHRNVEQLLINLEKSTFIYIECSYERKGQPHDAFSSDPAILCGFITQALSENECSITNNKNEADYELTLITSTSLRSDGSGKYGLISYYANAKGTLYNRLTKKRVVEFAILNDAEAYAAGKTPEDAATKAFKLPEVKDKVLNKILPTIKN